MFTAPYWSKGGIYWRRRAGSRPGHVSVPDWEAFCGPDCKNYRCVFGASERKPTERRHFDVTQQQQHVAGTPVFLCIRRRRRFDPLGEDNAPVSGRFGSHGPDTLGLGGCHRAESCRTRAKCALFWFNQKTVRSCQRTPQQHRRVAQECFIHRYLEASQSTLRLLDHADPGFIYKEGRHRPGTDGRQQRGNLNSPAGVYLTSMTG